MCLHERVQREQGSRPQGLLRIELRAGCGVCLCAGSVIREWDCKYQMFQQELAPKSECVSMRNSHFSEKKVPLCSSPYIPDIAPKSEIVQVDRTAC